MHREGVLGQLHMGNAMAGRQGRRGAQRSDLRLEERPNSSKRPCPMLRGWPPFHTSPLWAQMKVGRALRTTLLAAAHVPAMRCVDVPPAPVGPPRSALIPLARPQASHHIMDAPNRISPHPNQPSAPNRTNPRPRQLFPCVSLYVLHHPRPHFTAPLNAAHMDVPLARLTDREQLRHLKRLRVRHRIWA